MKSIRKVLASIKKADLKFNLINKGDKIAVGISGGKDSLVLFYALTLYQKFSKKDFSLVPILLNLGFSEVDFNPLLNWFSSLGYSLNIEDSTQVGEILRIQKGDKEKLSCSICSRMKKASINAASHKYGCNKVAFAHHAEDALETLWMNQVCGGRLATFAPKMHLEKTDLVFIRPLILARESNILGCANELNVPVTSLGCPNDKQTMRQTAKEYLVSLFKVVPEAKENLLNMLLNYEKEDLWKDKIEIPLLENDLFIKPSLGIKTYHDEHQIRYEVFVEEFNKNYKDEFINNEENIIHYVLYLKETPIGVITYHQIEDRKFKIHSFCIKKAYRNQGYGSLMLNYIEKILFDEFNPCIVTININDNNTFFLNKGYHIEENNLIKNL